MRIGGVFAIGSCLAACGGSAGKAKTPAPDDLPAGGGDTAAVVEPAGPPLPASPADFARADLVTIDSGAITGWSVAGGKLEKLGKATLATVDAEDYMSRISGDWVDRDHVALLIPPRDVVIVGPDKIRRVAVPPEAAFKTDRPKVEDQENLEPGGVMADEGMGLVTAGDAAYWVECPWGYPYDGWQCEQYTNAQLWPESGEVVEGDVDTDRWGWPVDKPDGYRLKELDDGHVLGCTPPAGTKQKQTQLRGVEEEGEMIQESVWVSVSPPRLLVIYGTPGYADLVPVRWTLHEGCQERPIAQGTSVEPGPAGLWVAWESPDPRAENVVSHQMLRRGAETLGELDEAGEVKFRPPAK